MSTKKSLSLVFVTILILAAALINWHNWRPSSSDSETVSDPRYAQIVQEAQKEAEDYFTKHPEFFDTHPGYPRPGDLGFCHTLWGKMKEIIKTKYGLDWKTPQEENPGVFFD